jgi:hypothetical protein
LSAEICCLTARAAIAALENSAAIAALLGTRDLQTGLAKSEVLLCV